MAQAMTAKDPSRLSVPRTTEGVADGPRICPLAQKHIPRGRQNIRGGKHGTEKLNGFKTQLLTEEGQAPY